MIDSPTQAVLQEIVRRESRSFFSYIGDSFPWTTVAGDPHLGTLRKLVQQEATALKALGQFLIRQKAPPPFIGSYPAAFTACNFLALDWLLPRLLEGHKRALAELQADLNKVSDPPARQEVERLLAVKKMSLAGLEGLATPPTPASV